MLTHDDQPTSKFNPIYQFNRRNKIWTGHQQVSSGEKADLPSTESFGVNDQAVFLDFIDFIVEREQLRLDF
jgi:hypothetical protein